MSSERRGWTLQAPRLIALGIAVLSCGSKQIDVGCSPTPSCSVAPERFAPPMDADAGRAGCDDEQARCPADQVAAGGAHTCALTPLGELFCWGDDGEQQLGGSAATDASADAPAQLTFAMQDAVALTAGDRHSCAIGEDDAVYCWGRNAEGQVDGVASGPVATATRVPGLAGRASAVAAGGAHSCALVDAVVYCWGSASHGQTGREVGDLVLQPGAVQGTDGTVELAAGMRHTCARLRSGRVLCWGELYDDDARAMRAVAEPQPVAGLGDVLQIAAGAGFSCALREGGVVVCWGDNASGQLGDGTRVPSATPVAVVDLDLSLGITAGGAERQGALVGHACAITRGFFAQCWGRNAEGQLGYHAPDDQLRPVMVHSEPDRSNRDPAFLPDITAISAGGFHTCEVDHDGPVLCWGADDHGQLGRMEAAPFGYPNEADVFSGEY